VLDNGLVKCIILREQTFPRMKPKIMIEWRAFVQYFLLRGIAFKEFGVRVLSCQCCSYKVLIIVVGTFVFFFIFCYRKVCICNVFKIFRCCRARCNEYLYDINLYFCQQSLKNHEVVGTW
jgi:hypothetical protein